MMGEPAKFLSTFYFSYNQFVVFDRSVRLPGCQWTENHFRQGFCRQERNVCLGTLLEFGQAELAVYLDSYLPRSEYERVVEVPLEVPSGEVAIEGPEEVGTNRFLKVAPGHYRLVAAQVVTGECEHIDLFLESVSEPLQGSRILVADQALSPPEKLIETAETA